MHVMLLPLRKFQLCANAVVPGKLQVCLKISDQSRAACTSTRKIPTRTFKTRILPEAPKPYTNPVPNPKALTLSLNPN